MPRSAFRFRLVLAAILGVALVVGFHPMIFNHLPHMFMTPAEDLSYGWAVPVFSLAVAYLERDRIRAALGAPGWGGLLFALPFLLIGLLGVRGVQVRFELVAFVGLGLSVAWALFGRAAAKAILFPMLFLLFCMPLASALAVVTVPLRLFVSAVSSGVLSACGMALVREGNLIALTDVLTADGGHFVVDIAAPCSGLRSIFALLALAAGYGYFTQPTWLRRGILFVLAVPCAIFGNILRIIVICLGARFVSPEFAQGTCHDLAGFLVFAVALGLLVQAGGLLSRIGATREGPAAPTAPTAVRGAGLWCSVAAALLIGGTMLYQAFAPAPALAPAPDVRLYDRVTLPGPLVFEGRDEAPSEAETNLLLSVGATVLRRNYGLTPEATNFVMSVVVSSANKSSLHRPELCLPSQGADIRGAHALSAAGTVWRVVELGGGPEGGAWRLAYTFFNQDGYRTDSHYARILRDTWDRSFGGCIDRWVMVSIATAVPEEALVRLLEAQKDLLP